jgi:hypothetical protein
MANDVLSGADAHAEIRAALSQEPFEPFHIDDVLGGHDVGAPDRAQLRESAVEIRTPDGEWEATVSLDWIVKVAPIDSAPRGTIAKRRNTNL